MDDQAAIRDVIARYLAAYESRDAAGCAAVYASDSIMLSPWSPPLHGPAEIAAAHTEWFGEGETNKVMTTHRLTVDGDIGVCLIHYNADVPGHVGKVCGASLNTLARQFDGSWKISLCSLNELEDDHTGFEE